MLSTASRILHMLRIPRRTSVVAGTSDIHLGIATLFLVSQRTGTVKNDTLHVNPMLQMPLSIPELVRFEGKGCATTDT